MRWLSLKKLIVLIHLLLHTARGKDLLEDLQTSDDNPSELNVFFEDVIKSKPVFEMIRKAAEEAAASKRGRRNDNLDVEEYIYDDVDPVTSKYGFKEQQQETAKKLGNANDAFASQFKGKRPLNDIYPHVYKDQPLRRYSEKSSNKFHRDEYGDIMADPLSDQSRFRRQLNENVEIQSRGTKGNVAVEGDKIQDVRPLTVNSDTKEAINNIFNQIGEVTERALDRTTNYDRVNSLDLLSTQNQMTSTDSNGKITSLEQVSSDIPARWTSTRNQKLIKEGVPTNEITQNGLIDQNDDYNDIKFANSLRGPNFFYSLPMIDKYYRSRNLHTSRNLKLSSTGPNKVVNKKRNVKTFLGINNEDDYLEDLDFETTTFAQISEFLIVEETHPDKALRKIEMSLTTTLIPNKVDNNTRLESNSEETRVDNNITSFESLTQTPASAFKINGFNETASKDKINEKQPTQRPLYSKLVLEQIYKDPIFSPKSKVKPCSCYCCPLQKRNTNDTKNNQFYILSQYSCHFKKKNDDNQHKNNFPNALRKLLNYNLSTATKRTRFKRALFDGEQNLDPMASLTETNEYLAKRTESDYNEEPDLSEGTNFKKHLKEKYKSRVVPQGRSFEDSYEYEEVKDASKKDGRRNAKKKKKKAHVHHCQSPSFKDRLARLKYKLFSGRHDKNEILESGDNFNDAYNKEYADSMANGSSDDKAEIDENEMNDDQAMHQSSKRSCAVCHYPCDSCDINLGSPCDPCEQCLCPCPPPPDPYPCPNEPCPCPCPPPDGPCPCPPPDGPCPCPCEPYPCPSPCPYPCPPPCDPCTPCLHKSDKDRIKNGRADRSKLCSPACVPSLEYPELTQLPCASHYPFSCPYPCPLPCPYPCLWRKKRSGQQSDQSKAPLQYGSDFATNDDNMAQYDINDDSSRFKRKFRGWNAHYASVSPYYERQDVNFNNQNQDEQKRCLFDLFNPFRSCDPFPCPYPCPNPCPCPCPYPCPCPEPCLKENETDKEKRCPLSCGSCGRCCPTCPKQCGYPCPYPCGPCMSKRNAHTDFKRRISCYEPCDPCDPCGIPFPCPSELKRGFYNPYCPCGSWPWPYPWLQRYKFDSTENNFRRKRSIPSVASCMFSYSSWPFLYFSYPCRFTNNLSQKKSPLHEPDVLSSPCPCSFPIPCPFLCGIHQKTSSKFSNSKNNEDGYYSTREAGIVFAKEAESSTISHDKLTSEMNPSFLKNLDSFDDYIVVNMEDTTGNSNAKKKSVTDGQSSTKQNAFDDTSGPPLDSKRERTKRDSEFHESFPAEDERSKETGNDNGTSCCICCPCMCPCPCLRYLLAALRSKDDPNETKFSSTEKGDTVSKTDPLLGSAGRGDQLFFFSPTKNHDQHCPCALKRSVKRILQGMFQTPNEGAGCSCSDFCPCSFANAEETNPCPCLCLKMFSHPSPSPYSCFIELNDDDSRNRRIPCPCFYPCCDVNSLNENDDTKGTSKKKRAICGCYVPCEEEKRRVKQSWMFNSAYNPYESCPYPCPYPCPCPLPCQPMRRSSQFDQDFKGTIDTDDNVVASLDGDGVPDDDAILSDPCEPPCPEPCPCTDPCPTPCPDPCLEPCPAPCPCPDLDQCCPSPKNEPLPNFAPDRKRRLMKEMLTFPQRERPAYPLTYIPYDDRGRDLTLAKPELEEEEVRASPSVNMRTLKEARVSRKIHGVPKAKKPNKKMPDLEDNDLITVETEDSPKDHRVVKKNIEDSSVGLEDVKGRNHARARCDNAPKPEDFMLIKKQTCSDLQDIQFAREIVESVMSKVNKHGNLRTKIGNSLNRKRIYENENQMQHHASLCTSEERAEYVEAKNLLHSVTGVLNKLVHKQIADKLCVRLPSYLFAFLKRIVRPPRHRVSARHDATYHEDTFLFRTANTELPIDPETRTHLQNVLQRLVCRYNRLDEESKKSAALVKSYIDHHLHMLRSLNPANAIGSKQATGENSKTTRNNKAEKRRFQRRLDKGSDESEREEKTEGKRQVSEQYKKLVEAANEVRFKRKNEEKIGEAFGDKKATDKESMDMDQAAFDSPLVYRNLV